MAAFETPIARGPKRRARSGLTSTRGRLREAPASFGVHARDPDIQRVDHLEKQVDLQPRRWGKHQCCQLRASAQERALALQLRSRDPYRRQQMVARQLRQLARINRIGLRARLPDELHHVRVRGQHREHP